MCCFAFSGPRSWLAALLTRPVRVRDTQIFARLDGSTQLLAYAMQLRAPGDGAMILPIPVRPSCGEHEVEFIDLSAAPDLFTRLHRAFMGPERTMAKRGGFSLPELPRPRLVVRQVGAFEASFVPGVADFDRLDPRFRLPDAVWSQLPVQGFGFAVFKLRETRGVAHVHPMAFRFPTRDPARLFFPTLHVHDGEAHRTAEFDHALYYQRADASVDPGHQRAWDAHAVREAAGRSRGLVDAGLPLARLTLAGKRANADTWVPASAP
jgi:hypothetical protein